MNNRSPFSNIPPVVKNLLIINVLVLLAAWVLKSVGIDLVNILGMHHPASEKFMLHQVVTYMFMHSMDGFAHIFFNMFALWMFGRVLESVWGSKRFFIYYFATGIGAIIIHTFIGHLQISGMQNAMNVFINTPAPELLDHFVNKYLPNATPQVYDFINSWYNDPTNLNYAGEGQRLMEQIMRLHIDTPTVGASGAVFGILLAFGMLFPNTELYMMFIPVPIKAKYFVIGYGLIELFLGIKGGGNVAHFAHLGGMLFGFILIKYWNKTKNTFY